MKRFCNIVAHRAVVLLVLFILLVLLLRLLLLRLLRLLRSVPVIDPDTVPSNSLLREFIGGSLIEI